MNICRHCRTRHHSLCKGCACERCALPVIPEERLEVECWCTARVVWVWPADLKAGKTGSCCPACVPGAEPQYRKRGRPRKVSA